MNLRHRSDAAEVTHDRDMEVRLWHLRIPMVFLAVTIGCAPGEEDFDTSAENPTIIIQSTLGQIQVEIDEIQAPVTAANFLRYVDQGFYDGGSFFRTVHAGNQPQDSIRIAVVQAGARSDTTASFFEPILLERTSETGLKHLDGTISMARGGPDSATHSFFFCIDDQPELDFGGKRNPDGQGFAAFGQVISGGDVLRAIQMSPHEVQQLQPPIEILSIRRK